MRRYAMAAIAGALLIGLGFGIAKAYYGWQRLATPCQRITAITAGFDRTRFAVVCAEEPGTIYVQQP